MKLYTVTVKYDFVVVAEDAIDASIVGEEFAREALSDMGSSEAILSTRPGVHAHGWDDMCIPYGGDGNTRTGEYKQTKIEQE